MAEESTPPVPVPTLPNGPHFAIGGAVFGELQPDDVALIAELGYPGIEPYRNHLMAYLARPQTLKALLDRHGVTMVTCSNGGEGQSTDFIDPAARPRTIEDHVAFARDFLTVFGCRHFKINMGARPAHPTTDDEIARIADTLNELGRRTAAFGIRLAPHPHIWGPIERPHEVERLLALTDPAFVSLILDTAQINLGGGDPLALLETHYDRVLALHWKDSKASYRGFTGETPTQAMHAAEILYKDLGAGGVDLPAIWELMRARGYRYWVTLDLDPPRQNEGEGTVRDKLEINTRYVRETLGAAHL